MAQKPPETQFTPRGLEIPIPTRGEFESNLDKVLKAPPPLPKYRKKKRSASRTTGASDK